MTSISSEHQCYRQKLHVNFAASYIISLAYSPACYTGWVLFKASLPFYVASYVSWSRQHVH